MGELSFLQKLGKFCGNVERDISEQKEALRLRAGTRPQNYGAAMETLKTEVEAVTKLSSDLKPKLAELDTVRDFRCSLKEVIGDYKEDIRKAEEFMKGYGYKPPTDDSYLFHEEKISTEEPKNEVNLENPKMKIEETLMSPELSEFSKTLMKGAKPSCLHLTPRAKPARTDIPMIFSAKRTQCNSVHRARLEEHLVNVPPTPSYGEDILTPFITSKNIRPKLFAKVPFDVNFAEENDLPISCDQNIPPSIKNTQNMTGMAFRSTTEYKGTMNTSTRQPINNKVSAVNRIDVRNTPSVVRNTPSFPTKVTRLETPESPVMSDLTMRFLNGENVKQITPESPAMSDYTVRIFNAENVRQITPESPAMTDATVRICSEENVGQITPESPDTSCVPKRIINSDSPDIVAKYNFKNSKLNFLHLNESQDVEDSVKSPVFSEATINILKNRLKQ